MSETIYTPGALRAATRLDEQHVADGLPADFLSRRQRINAMADFIDRETGSRELLASLEKIRARLLKGCTDHDYKAAVNDCDDIAEAAIRARQI